MSEGRSAAAAGRGRLAIVLALSSMVFVAELVVGLLSNSLALLVDASHVFTDMSGVALALFAIWFATRQGGERRSYGYFRVEILAAVINALLLFGIAGLVLVETWRRLGAAPEIHTGPMMVVAGVGLLANLVSAAILHGAAAGSLNLQGAYLEVLSDAAGSVAVLVAGGVIALTGFKVADAIASGVIGVLILPRTWRLFREAIDILLEAAPKGMEVAEARRHILETPGVRGVHDLHAWTITSGMHVVSAHVVVQDDADREMVLDDLSKCLAGHFDIAHSTFQLETDKAEDAEHLQGAHP